MHEAELVYTGTEMLKKNRAFAVLEKQRLSIEVFLKTSLVLSPILRGH